MIRIILQELALFVIPFALYALLLVLQRKKVVDPEHWSEAKTWLAMAGFVLAIVGLLTFGLFGESHTGPYVPPHLENGKPVQGGFR
jgi:Mn2+/Fe2+ NRAMP family transporter